MEKRDLCLLVLLLIHFSTVEAQWENRFIRKGTKEYESKKYNEEEIAF
mgnify:FL=1